VTGVRLLAADLDDGAPTALVLGFLATEEPEVQRGPGRETRRERVRGQSDPLDPERS